MNFSNSIRIAFMAAAATAHKVPTGTGMVNALKVPKNNRKKRAEWAGQARASRGVLYKEQQ